MTERLAKGEDALELSIEKWQDIVDGKGEDKSTSYCALCHVNVDCDNGCPVWKKTGRLYCERSPHEEYVAAVRAKVGKEKLVALAKKEVAFLKSLRKK